MTLGGLFSGIGGFELAAQRAGITPLWSNEIDSFCCKVLRKNFSHEIIEADIRSCGAGRKHELAQVDIICGGFPCQPFSTAGQRKGKGDNRYLWPEMLRTIREVKPTWVVGENVAGILSMDDGAVFDQICASLEDEGYTVEAYNIPACSVGAPHRRERIWIIAHANDILQRRQAERRELSGEAKATEGTEQREGWNELFWKRSRAVFGDGFEDCFSTNSAKQRLQNGGSEPMGEPQEVQKFKRCDGKPIAAEQFNEHWIQTASRICRTHNGVSRRVDRTNRLKALGNAIVPQIAQVLFESILQV